MNGRGAFRAYCVLICVTNLSTTNIYEAIDETVLNKFTAFASPPPYFIHNA